ncbi:hypothetical protein [Streptomyces sp. NPDC005423]|uniref:hypothetical protein n=1 Tax=Streptomyces sp. NPDC005423 TaxID=3155343 RepID=UPI0033BAFD57
MGIRMLHRRKSRARTQSWAPGGTAARDAFLPPGRAFAAAASTARLPVDLAMALERTAADLRRLTRRKAAAGTDTSPATPLPATPTLPASAGTSTARHTPVWRLWTDLGRGYLGLVLSRLPRSRRIPTTAVFIATRTDGSGRR